MPTIGDTSENARANAERRLKSLTGVCDRSVMTAGSGGASAMSVPFFTRSSICWASTAGARAGDPVGGVGQYWLRAGARGQVEAGHMAGDGAERCYPQPGQLGHPLDQPLERAGPAGTAGQERVAGQRVRGADLVVGLEFEQPHLQRLGRALDDPGPDQVGQERVLLPVIEPPPDRNLDQAGLVAGPGDGEPV